MYKYTDIQRSVIAVHTDDFVIRVIQCLEEWDVALCCRDLTERGTSKSSEAARRRRLQFQSLHHTEHPVSLVGMMDEEDVVLWFKDTHSLAGRNGGRIRRGVEVWRWTPSLAGRNGGRRRHGVEVWTWTPSLARRDGGRRIRGVEV